MFSALELYLFIGLALSATFDITEMRSPQPYHHFPSHVPRYVARTFCAVYFTLFWAPLLIATVAEVSVDDEVEP